MTTLLDSSVGIKKETTFGTAVTVDRFPEFVSESLDWKNSYRQSEGKRAGSRMARAKGRVLDQIDAGGQLRLEAVTKGLGLFLNAALGTSTVNETADTGVFLQVHTPSTVGKVESFTLQKGIVPVGGAAVQPYTFLGAMCEQMELDFSGGILAVSLDWIAREVVTTEAYASPSYATGSEPFAFVHGEIYAGATVTKPTATTLASTADTPVATIKGGKLTVKNNLDGDGYNLGGAGRRTRASERGVLDVSGSLDVELADTKFRKALLDQEDMSLLLTFEHPSAIGANSHPTLQVYIPLVRFNDGLPMDNNTKPVNTTMNFVVLDSLAASTEPIYICYQSSDTAL